MANLLHFLQTIVPLAEREGAWMPAADIYRTPGGWLIKFDVAGVRPEDVRLTVQGSCITLHGTRRDLCVEEGCHCYRMEIAYSDFERTITMPGDLEKATISAEHRHGMLLVRIQMET